MNKSTLKSDVCPTWTHELSHSERRFVAAMNELGFGRFELLRIRGGELLLDPWPKAVRVVKFGPQDPSVRKGLQNAFELRPAVRQFLEYVRSVVDGGILCLECRHGLPFSMEVAYRPDVVQSPTVQRG